MKNVFAFATLLSAPALLHAAEAPAKAFLNKNCVSCHDGDVQKGGLRLDQLSLRGIGPDQRLVLARVFDRVRAGEMPPKKATQPTPAARQAFLGELKNALAASDSPTNLHWLINNTGKTATEPAPSQEDMKSNTRSTTGPADDLSSNKLNLDMV